MENSLVNVLIVDDHTLFRKGMVMITKTFPCVKQVFDAEHGAMALEVLKETPIDVVLLDLDMPVMDGWQTSREIMQLYPEVQVVIVSMNDSLETISKMIDSGIHSYIMKSAPPEEVLRAIESTVNDDFYYSHLISNSVSHTGQDSIKDTIQESTGLTKREVEILELICKEMTMKEIGDYLTISEATIQTHRKNLMKKIEAKNAVGLVKFAFQQHLISF